MKLKQKLDLEVHCLINKDGCRLHITRAIRLSHFVASPKFAPFGRKLRIARRPLAVMVVLAVMFALDVRKLR